MVSSGLVKMANTARTTANTIKGANGQLAQSYDEIRNRINSLETAISKSRSVDYIRQAKRELADLQRMASRAPGNLDRTGFFGGLANQVRGFLPALGVAGLLSLGGNIVNAGLQGQARQTSFEVMAGQRDGTRLNQDLTKFAQDSIYGNELYQNAQTMLAFGASAKEIMPDLRMLGDVAMGNKEKLGSLTLAFSQTRAAGKLTGQEVLQFVNAGFNPLQIISEKTGISMGVLRKQMEKGQISFQMVKDAFISATSAGGRFFGMTDRIAQTDFGKWEAFKGQLDGVSLKLGGVLAPLFGKFISTVLVPFVNVLSTAVTWLEENGKWIGFVASIVGGAVVAIGTITTAVKLWTLAQTFLNVALTANPIGLIIVAIGAAVAAVIYALNKFEGFRGTLMGLLEVGKLLGSVFVGLGKVLVGALMFNPQMMLEGMKQVASAAVDIANGGIAKRFNKGYDQGTVEFQIARAEKGRQERKALLDELRGSKNERLGKTTAIPTSTSLSDALGRGSNSQSIDETVKGIAGGGPRVINITINKLVEKIELSTTTLTDGLNEIEAKVEDAFLRVLNSGARTQ